MLSREHREQSFLLVDLATGTADVGIRLVQHYQEKLAENEQILPGEQLRATNVLGVDPSKEMLRLGRAKIEELGLADSVRLQLGDAQDLKSAGVQDQSADAITMSFGIRNVPDRAKALRECHRALKAGREVG